MTFDISHNQNRADLAGDLETRSLKALEWERLKLLLSHEAEGAPARELCLSLPLFDDREIIQNLLAETDEAVSLYSTRSALPVNGMPDLRECIKRMQIGGSLDGEELVALRIALQIFHRLRASLALLDHSAFPALSPYAQQLPKAEPVLTAIDAALDEAGNVRDDASPELRQLRHEVQRIDRNIRETINKMIHSSTVSKLLVEPLYTQRNGRYVLPVNAAMRSQLPGIVHDSSSSGLTVYVEPMAVLELSNKLRMKQTEIDREVARILDELSRVAAMHCGEIEQSFDTTCKLDAIMARARLAVKYDGTLPELSENNCFSFARARHPLLVLKTRGEGVVANDIKLGERHSRTLMITGPNTGGKTVLLKTVGIFALMVRAGLLLPAEKGSSAAIFKHVFADIGDEQSLEQSLSTFSSHMVNIVEIVRRVTGDTLVLLDEVGAGTDPREGAALARAVLEHLNNSQAVTISTTHYGELKTLAYTEEGFINGSLEFDDATLSPTYKLRLGVPGSSKATTIAKRLGLEQSVIERSLSLIETSDRDLQGTIDRLEEKLLSLSDREESVERMRQAAEQQESELAARLEELQNESQQLKRRVSHELESELKLATDYVKHLIKDLQQHPDMAKAQRAQKDLEKLRHELRWDEPLKGKALKASPQLAIGQSVKIKSLGQRGIVSAMPADWQGDQSAMFTVQSGTMKIKAPASDLEIVQNAQPAKSNTPSGKKQRTYQPAANTYKSAAEKRNEVFVQTQANTLDLRGQRVDAALSAVERFLDEAQLNGISPLMIIHGHGTGAVKSAVRDYLGSSAYTDSFRPGEMYEGGDGVTIVSL
ncbi:MAG TPA: endonuclease MutS2 [Chroococcales cyanobacterium]